MLTSRVETHPTPDHQGAPMNDLSTQHPSTEPHTDLNPLRHHQLRGTTALATPRPTCPRSPTSCRAARGGPTANDDETDAPDQSSSDRRSRHRPQPTRQLEPAEACPSTTKRRLAEAGATVNREQRSLLGSRESARRLVTLPLPSRDAHPARPMASLACAVSGTLAAPKPVRTPQPTAEARIPCAAGRSAAWSLTLGL